MLTALKRRLWRNRRRMCFTFVCFAFFGAVHVTQSEVHLLEMAFVGAFFGLMMTLGLGFLALIIQRWRALMEISATFTLLSSTIMIVAPGLGTSLTGATRTFVIFAICFAIANLYQGPLLDRFLRRGPAVIRGQAKTRLAPADVWRGLYGRPEDQAQLYNADRIVAFERVPDQPETYRVVEMVDDLTQIEEWHKIEFWDAPHNLRYRWWVPTAAPDVPAAHGTFDATLTPTRTGGTKITMRYDIDAFSPRMVLFAWMDDHFGRAMDDRLGPLETRGTSDTPPIDLAQMPA